MVINCVTAQKISDLTNTSCSTRYLCNDNFYTTSIAINTPVLLIISLLLLWLFCTTEPKAIASVSSPISNPWQQPDRTNTG